MQFSAMKRLQVLAVLFQAALLTSALPVEKRGTAIHSGKRIILWDYTLTQAYQSNGNIQASAASLSTSPDVSAAVNWNTWKPEELSDDIPFQPMIRTPEQLAGDDWKNLLSVIQAGGSNTVVHFYNEPDLNGVAVGDAVAAWKNSVLPLRAQYGVKLVGPAVTSDPASTAWLDQFYASLSPEENPDFLGLHFYTGETTPGDVEANNAISYIEAQHKAHPLPVIVSEIASTSRDPASVDAFSKKISQWLDTTDYVNSYGFFGATPGPVNEFVSPAAQLIDTSGAWTPLGHWFVGN